MASTSTGLFMGGTEPIEPFDKEVTFVNGEDSNLNFSDDGDSDNDVPYENPHTGLQGSRRQDSAYSGPEQVDKDFKVHGGKAPVAKPVTEEYDYWDERLWELKNQGYVDHIVANKLREEGGPSYVSKTISSRYLRICKIKDKRNDDRLDDELSDWHQGEDSDLEEALTVANEKITLEMEKLTARKWKLVSARLESRLGKKKYTAKACQQRWDALQDGTALPPIEIDPDPEGRTVLRETRIAAAKATRAAAKAEIQRDKDAKEAAVRQKRELKERKYRDKLETERLRREERAETRRLMEERKRGKEEKKAALAECAALWKGGIEEGRRVRDLEERVYRKLTGKSLKRIRRVAGFGEDFEEEEDGESNRFLSDDDEEEEEEGADVELSDAASNNDMPSGFESDSASAASTVSLEIIPVARPKVTPFTLLNPRSIMTTPELRELMTARGLSRHGTHDTQPQLVARLAAIDATLSYRQLDDLLRGTHLVSQKGTKIVKMQRLADLDAGRSDAGKSGVSSTDREFKVGYEGYVGQYARFVDEVPEGM